MKHSTLAIFAALAVAAAVVANAQSVQAPDGTVLEGAPTVPASGGMVWVRAGLGVPLLMAPDGSGSLQLPELDSARVLLLDGVSSEPVTDGTLTWVVPDAPAELVNSQWHAAGGSLDLPCRGGETLEFRAAGYAEASYHVILDGRRHTVLLQPVGALTVKLQPSTEARLWLAREDSIDVANLFSQVAVQHDIAAQGPTEVQDLDLGAAYVALVVAPGAAPVQASVERLPHSLVLDLDQGLHVSGTVVDENDEPLAGARVEALGKLAELDGFTYTQDGTTSGNGVFTITGLLPGEVRVRACAEGRACSQLALELSDNDGGEPLVFKLQPGHDVSLSIVNELGRPVGEVTVYLEDRILHTDDHGQLTIEGVAGGSLPITVRGEGFGSFAGTIDTDREEVVLEVPGGGVIERQVLTARRFEDDEVLVTWQRFTADGREEMFGRGEWEAERGVARATGLRPGSFELTVRLPGSLPLTSERVEVRLGDEIVLPPAVPDRGLAISGRVLDAATLQPLPGARVRCEPGSPAIFRKPIDVASAPSVLSDEDGVFLLEGLSKGACRAIVEASGFAAYRRDGVEPDDAGFDLGDIEMDAGMTVVGQVRDRLDHPVTGAVVEITEAAAYAYFSEARARTDHDGYFRVEQVPVGRFKVTAKQGGRTARTTITGRARETVTADLVLGGIRIEGEVWLGDRPAQGGTVVLTTGGAQAQGVVVMFDRGGAGDRELFGLDAPPVQLAVATDGRFAGAGLEPGRYWASYTSTESGAAPVTKVIDVPRVDTFQCVLQYSDAAVEGFVVDVDGQAVAGASVLASASGGAQEATAFSDGDGRFSVRGLEPGSVVLTASHDGFSPSEPAEVELSEGRSEGPVVLELEPPDGAKIDLTLRTAAGSVGGAPIYLVGTDTATGFTDGSGFAHFSGLPAGAYRPCGFAYGGATGCGTDLRVVEGDQLQASLDLGQGGYVEVLYGAEKSLPRVTVVTADGIDLSSMLFMASPPQPMPGGVRIGPLQVDDYIITVASPAGPRQGQVTIADGQAKELDLR
jgi:protocatechuate 3,4-dioxygenase beta subunit